MIGALLLIIGWVAATFFIFSTAKRHNEKLQRNSPFRVTWEPWAFSASLLLTLLVLVALLVGDCQ